jgi:flagellar protein FlbD
VIHVTRLNGRPVIVNADMLMTVESTPDTILTFANGDKLVVKESVERVVDGVIAYRRKVGRLVVHRRGEDHVVLLDEEKE